MTISTLFTMRLLRKTGIACPFIFIILLFVTTSYSQNALVGTGFSNGWGGGSCPTGNTNFNYLSSSFGSSFGGVLTPAATGDRYFRFGVDWSGTTSQLTITQGSDVTVTPNSPYSLNTNCTTSGALKLNVPSTSYRYVFKTQNGGTNPSGNFIIFEVQGAVQSVTSVSQSPASTGVTASTPVNVTATLGGSLNTGQSVFLRYTTDNWSNSSLVSMTGSGTSYSATIPVQTAGTTVSYYILTSGTGASVTHLNADLYTINGNNNGGSNYSYTVAAGSPLVTVSPSLPLDNVPVTITFNATGTALAGAAKVYLHSGVSVSQSSPTSFNYSVGNWGQDDGVGLMSSTGTNTWQITINPGLRSFYGVPADKDVFGLNFLFRNATGTLKEDNSGSNFYNAVNPGSYFNITFPTVEIYFVPVGQAFNHTATANNAPLTWTLKEIDPVTGNDLSTVTTVSGGTTFTHSLTMTNTSLRSFKLIADFGSGGIKYKTFKVNGYNPVNEVPRPSWTKPGINYHTGDPTKATLVLHAPTYTRYKKGTGTQSGTSNTTAKSTVYVIGDFNNWTPSEAFKMNRDRDGWNGSTDADGDDDRGDYWWIELSGLVPGQEYVFQYLIDGSIRVADPYTAKVSDPDDWQIPASVYPNLITYRPQASDRASVLQTGQTQFQWTADPFTPVSVNNLNIYEMHFRDFTEEGTYLKAIDKLDHIKGLGINAIHVMPVSEFEGNSSWGYNPNFYFAADKAYGTANDLKKFIDECHKRKIQVFNDIVLNHAFYSNVMAKMYWNSGANKPANENPWFNPDHKMIADPGGWWGADWNHESEHTQAMVDRILDYWLQEYKFDGFRFDFTKGFGQTAPDANDPWASSPDQDRVDLLLRMSNGMKTRNPGSVVIFEHLAWASEDKALSDTGILMWSGVGHHNDLKNFVLGYNNDNPNIYDSGIYNAPGRNFSYANWMSYGESHDEERLGYEVTQYFNGTKTLDNIVNRLKLGAGFNLFFPGPRMLWQFQEMGYDISIDYNGRTGEKPVHWEYYDNAKRRELYTLMSRIFKIRNNYSIYATAPDYGNIGLGAGNIATPRVMRLSSGTGASAKHVIIIGNLDPAGSQTAYPGYDVTGTWYRYNGATSVDGTSFTVNNTGDPYTLQPSEMLVLTNFQVDDCFNVRNNADSGTYSLRAAIDCVPEGGTVTIEYPVYGQTIQLLTPINISKSVSIVGFPSKNVTVSGSGFSGSVFSVAAGKSVTMNGMTVTCSQGGADGRCLVNAGILKLDDVLFKDQNGGASGSSVINTGAGTIQVSHSVAVSK